MEESLLRDWTSKETRRVVNERMVKKCARKYHYCADICRLTHMKR